MSKSVLVLGAGLIGAEIAVDLSREPEFRVSLADRSPSALNRVIEHHQGQITPVEADLADSSVLASLVRSFDLVCGALPSHLGLNALRTVLEVGRPYCDISFMPEDPTQLDSLARQQNVAAVVDCGVAPGLSHMIAGRVTATLDPCERIEIYVGGVPTTRRKPFEYKAPFAPSDVIEEYTRPSRVVEFGQIVEKPALSEAETIDLPGVGTLEAFNTDGLRTLIKTLKVPHMVEKTLRWPGHAELMATLRHIGLFSLEPVEVKGQMVVPRDLLETLLFPLWSYEDGEKDLTVLRLVASGLLDGQEVRWVWDLLDHGQNGVSSMARTTAYPCSIMARLMAQGLVVQPGVHPPEIPGADPAVFNSMVEGLKSRGVSLSDHFFSYGNT